MSIQKLPVRHTTAAVATAVGTATAVEQHNTIINDSTEKGVLSGDSEVLIRSDIEKADTMSQQNDGATANTSNRKQSQQQQPGKQKVTAQHREKD